MPEDAPLPTAAPPSEVAVAHCLLDARGTVLSAHDPERPFYAASTIKLHVMAAILRAVEAGELGLATELPVTRTFTGSDGALFTLGGDHLDPTHPADGTPIMVRELVVRMIARSSNEATDQLIEVVGLDAVDAAIAALDLRATRVERLIGDAAALEVGATNETSAGDLAATMLALVGPSDGTGPTAPAAPGTPARPGVRLAREALAAQQIPIIATVLRPGVPWGSKSGWVDGYRHDVAVVGDPDEPGVRVLAVMTAGLAPEEAERRITALVRELLPDVSA